MWSKEENKEYVGPPSLAFPLLMMANLCIYSNYDSSERCVAKPRQYTRGTSTATSHVTAYV